MIPFFRKLRWLAERSSKEAELREELRFHLEEEAEQRQREGLPEEEALWAARRELGNATAVEESTRAVWGWTFLEQLVQDVRYALRAMLRNRAFTALSLLSLALGIGANTAIYSFMGSILLRALPVAHPESLALLNWHSKEPRGVRPNHVMHGMYGETWADRDGVTSGIFAYYPSDSRTLTINGQAEVAHGEYVSGDYFRGLAVPPAAGRLLLADDDRAGAPLVVVISMRLSQRRFSGAANAVQSRKRAAVRGERPPGRPPRSGDPRLLRANANALRRHSRRPRCDAFARVALGRWQAAGHSRRRHAGPGNPDSEHRAPVLLHHADSHAPRPGDRRARPAGLPRGRLVIASVGLYGTMAYAVARRTGEIGIRMALGAQRGTVVRMIFRQVLLLAAVGLVVGIPVALGASRLVESFLFGIKTNDPLALASAVSILLGAALLAGYVPARKASRIDPITALRHE